MQSLIEKYKFYLVFNNTGHGRKMYIVLLNERSRDISVVQLRVLQICHVYQTVNNMSVCYYTSETEKSTPLSKQHNYD